MLLTVYRNKSRCILNTGAHFGCLGSLVVLAFDPVTIFQNAVSLQGICGLEELLRGCPLEETN
jgi:hypothetical protein